MDSEKKSKPDILPINWYWPKNNSDFSDLSNKIMDNVTTEDNDKKIARKTEALMNDAIKKLSGKTIVGNIITSEDLEKLLHPGIEEQTRTMAFGHREHNLPKNNAMMQLAITKKILMMQKAIARAGLPVHLAHYSEQPMKKSVSTSIVEKPASEIESFEKARNKRMGNKNRRPQYRPWEPLEGAGSYMPDSVFQDWGEKVLPYWGFKPLQTDPDTGVPMKKDPSGGNPVRDPGGPVKLEAKPGVAPIAARVARGALTTLVLGGLFGLDMVNHSLTGVFNSRGPDNRGVFSSANEHAASLFGSPFPFREKSSLSTIMNNVRPDSPWQTMFANLNAAKPKISDSGKNIVWSEKAPTYQQMKYFNEKTSPYKAFDREKLDAYVEKMFNKNRMHYGSLLGQNNTVTGTYFHPHYANHWDDLPQNLLQERNANPGWATNSAPLYSSTSLGALPRTSSTLEEQANKEKVYLRQVQNIAANAAYRHWTKMIDPKNPVMPTMFSPRSQTYQPVPTNPLEWTHGDGTKVLSTALNSLGIGHPKQTGKSKIVPNVTPSLIMSDPFWHHAYETEHHHGIDPIP